MTEKEWSKKLTKKLEDRQFFVQRIESGSTGRGIPDMFVVTPYLCPLWIENKIISLDKNIIKRLEAGDMCQVKIPWREGQLAWHSIVARSVPCFTITKIAGTKYVLLTMMNYLFGLRNDMINNYATVKRLNTESYYGLCENDTIFLREDILIDFITSRKFS